MPPRRRLGLRQLPAAAREFDFGDDGADVAVVDTSKSIGKGSGGIRNEVASRRQDTGPSEAKKARQDISAKEVIVVEDKEKTKDDATMVLGLYQQGMLPDHTLQLQFMRRKPVIRSLHRAQDEFVLPRPPLVIKDLLPTPGDLTLEDFLMRRSSQDTAIQREVVFDEALHNKTIEDFVQSWPQVTEPSPQEQLAWRALQECDWLQIHQMLVAKGCDAAWPINVLTALLTALHSDALALFVWHHILQQSVQLTLAQDQTQLSAFLTALLQHPYFERLSTKDFRSQLRAKSLQAHLNTTDTDVELLLMSLFLQCHTK